MANGRSSRNTRDIEERTFEFAVRIVKLAQALPKSLAGSTVARQVIRAGTSVGANVQEAQGSPSKRDFTWRVNVARCEAREALYWLRLIVASGLLPEKRLQDLTREANELVSILTAIVKRSRAGDSTMARR